MLDGHKLLGAAESRGFGGVRRGSEGFGGFGGQKRWTGEFADEGIGQHGGQVGLEAHLAESIMSPDRTEATDPRPSSYLDGLAGQQAG